MLNNNSFVDNAGTLSNLATGTINNNTFGYGPGSLLRNSGTLSNFGTLNNNSSGYGAGSRLVNSNSLSNYGTLNNNSDSYGSATLTNKLGATLSNSGTLNNPGSIINDGAITNTGAFTVTSTGIVNGAGTFTQTAGITTVDGELSGSSVTFSGGIVTGTGIVDPPNSIVIGASAIVKPGLSIGTLTFQGDTQFGGELDIEIGGASFYDILSVVGAIHFLPGSEIKFIFEGYDPLMGDSFQFLDSDVLDGFSNLRFLFEGLGPGFDFQLSDAGDGNLAFETLEAPGGSGGDVPEPGTALLVALGLLGIVGSRLRRAEPNVAG